MTHFIGALLFFWGSNIFALFIPHKEIQFHVDMDVKERKKMAEEFMKGAAKVDALFASAKAEVSFFGRKEENKKELNSLMEVIYQTGFEFNEKRDHLLPVGHKIMIEAIFLSEDEKSFSRLVKIFKVRGLFGLIKSSHTEVIEKIAKEEMLSLQVRVLINEENRIEEKKCYQQLRDCFDFYRQQWSNWIQRGHGQGEYLFLGKK